MSVQYRAGRMRPALALLATGCLLAACAVQAAQQAAGQRLPQRRLSAGIHLIQAEVAQTGADRARGLMFRESLGPSEGMLFVFEQAETQCFWMRNTLIPLSIAFLADDGRVVNIADMAPQTDTPHCSAEPVRYALEMNQGWFARRGIVPGKVVDGLP